MLSVSQNEERLYLADYLVENCDGYYQDIGIPKRKIKEKIINGVIG